MSVRRLKRRFFAWLHYRLFSSGRAYHGVVWWEFGHLLCKLAEFRQIAQEWLADPQGCCNCAWWARESEFYRAGWHICWINTTTDRAQATADTYGCDRWRPRAPQGM